MLSVGNAEIEDEATVTRAIEWYEKGMDFADGLHVGSAGRERKFAIFDTVLRRRARRPGLGAFAAV